MFEGLTLAYCVTRMEEVYCGTMAQMKDKKNKRKRGQTSTLPHMAPMDVGTEFTITFLEDKFELNNTSSRSHISPKHTLCHLKMCIYSRRLNKNNEMYVL